MKHIFKKSIILLLLFQLCAITADSQRFRTVSGESRNQLLNKITSVSSRMNTMECRFEQTQKMQALSQVVKSEGYMQYQKPGCMRWQYTAPTNYCFIVNNGKTVMKQVGKTIRNQGTKVFAGISKMVLSGISGNGLIDEKNSI
jgi:outer membrane lipoprotein-sorting protein